MQEIVPVLLCGGSGTRLWPVSRKAMPKQFTRLVGEDTLFQAALTRLSGQGWGAPVLVTSADYLDLARGQAAAVGISPASVLVEPAPRNTGPAILAAALYLGALDPDALMLVAPSDHAIPDAAAFRDAVAAGAERAAGGEIVTFGICPTRAETGYGWLELTERPSDLAPRPLGLAGFVEKPNAARAAEMLAEGRYLWNAGIFLATARTLLAAFQTHAPGLMAPVQGALADAERCGGVFRMAPGSWAEAEDISVDYAVMERADNLCVVPFGAGWSDLGDWNAIWRESARDEGGLVSDGAVTAIGCTNSLLRSEVDGLELVGIGLADMVAVAMEDTVLIAHRDRSQEVKEAVARLKSRGAAQAERFSSRAAQWSEAEADGIRYASRCLRVEPGAEPLVTQMRPGTRLTVLSGRAVATLRNERIELPAGASLAGGESGPAQVRNAGFRPLILLELSEEPLMATGTEAPQPLAMAAE
jgi:mannose-1-phosphate guanylyltransferase/mannose-6-phosphate isomerase